MTLESYYIKQTIANVSKDVIEDKDSIAAILNLLGQSPNTIKQAIESKTTTPISSAVNSGAPENRQFSRFDDNYMTEIPQQSNMTIFESSSNNIIVADSNLPSPIDNKRCWQRFLCKM
jgi:hypothetical protein